MLGSGVVEDPDLSRIDWPVIKSSTGFVGDSITEADGEKELVLARS